jgi:hypothetical protein
MGISEKDFAIRCTLGPPDDLDGFAPSTDMNLDAGIRHAVLVLRRGGVETFESCEGGVGHALPEPTIRFHGNAWAGHKAFAVAMEEGLAVLAVRRSYSVIDGNLEGPWWEMTFRTTSPPR